MVTEKFGQISVHGIYHLRQTKMLFVGKKMLYYYYLLKNSLISSSGVKPVDQMHVAFDWNRIR